MTIDYVINLAIDLEKKAVNLYKNLAHNSNNNKSKKLFTTLAAFEESHAQLLESLKEIPEILMPSIELKIDPHILATKEFDYEIDTDSSFKDIFLYAINEETKANKLYQQLAKGYPHHKKIEQILLKLADDEERHKKELQKALKKINQLKNR